MKIEPSEIERVLVVGLSCIGDMLLSSAALYNLRMYLPRAHFTICANAQVSAMLADDPMWDEIKFYDRGKPDSPYNGWRGRVRAIREFRAGKYDLIVDLRSTLIPLFMNCRYRPLWGWREVFLPRKVHEAERNLYCMQTLGVPLRSRSMRLYVPRDIHRGVQRELAPYRNKLVILNPGGRAFKRWPAENFAALGRRLGDQGYKVAVMGYSAEEQAAAAPVLASVPKRSIFRDRSPCRSALRAWPRRACMSRMTAAAFIWPAPWERRRSAFSARRIRGGMARGETGMKSFFPRRARNLFAATRARIVRLDAIIA